MDANKDWSMITWACEWWIHWEQGKITSLLIANVCMSAVSMSDNAAPECDVSLYSYSKQQDLAYVTM